MFSSTRTRPSWIVGAAGAFLAALAARVSSAAGPIQIELKQAAVLQTAEVRLRQVAEVSGDAVLAADISDVSLGMAPWPGNSRTVTKEQVVRHLVTAGFDVSGIQWRGAAACLVTLETTKVTGEQIVQTGWEYLASLPMLKRDDARIEVEQTPRDCIVAGSPEKVSLSAFGASADHPWGRLQIFVKIKVADKVLTTIPLMFMVTINEKVLVTTRPINRGELIERASLDTREIVLGPDSTPQTYLDPSPDSAVGKVAVRSIPAGTALTASMVAEPLAIKRGEDVTLSLKSAHMEVITKGVAEKDGYVGDLIPVKVFVSGKDLTCKVVGNGMVELPL
jgi:flagella basal body P-ring formation protein FlgA